MGRWSNLIVTGGAYCVISIITAIMITFGYSPFKYNTDMATMKSNNAAIAANAADAPRALHRRTHIRHQNGEPSKSMEGAVNYLCSQIQKSGPCVVDDTTVMNILVHYFDENEIEEGGKVNCNIVVAKAGTLRGRQSQTQRTGYGAIQGGTTPRNPQTESAEGERTQAHRHRTQKPVKKSMFNPISSEMTSKASTTMKPRNLRNKSR